MPVKVGDRGLFLVSENIRSMTPWYYNEEVEIIRESRSCVPPFGKIYVVKVLCSGDNVVVNETDIAPF